MRKVGALAAAVCLMLIAGVASAKDKEYQDGILKNVVYAGDDWESNITGNGRHRVYYFDFTVVVGDTRYQSRYKSKKRNYLQKNDWAVGSPVEVRFKKKSALIAHATFMYIQKPNSKKGKEIETVASMGWGPHAKSVGVQEATESDTQ